MNQSFILNMTFIINEYPKVEIIRGVIASRIELKNLTITITNSLPIRR